MLTFFSLSAIAAWNSSASGLAKLQEAQQGLQQRWSEEEQEAIYHGNAEELMQ
jgi:hypothetical protein